MCNRLQLENFLNHLILGKVRSMRKLWKGLISMEGVPAGFTWSPGRRFFQNTNVSSDYKISCWCRISPLHSVAKQNTHHGHQTHHHGLIICKVTRTSIPATRHHLPTFTATLPLTLYRPYIRDHTPFSINIHHFATLHCSVWIWHGLWLLDIALPIPVRPTHLTYLPDIPACTSYLRYTYLPISTTHLTYNWDREVLQFMFYFLLWTVEVSGVGRYLQYSASK